ncbi:MAG: NADH-quinone oxidoreductase subunit K [Hyphomicrobium sp.]|nr:NADH-quinone oxidoreductase subunit K [Hyphomicrobium sp.]
MIGTATVYGLCASGLVAIGLYGLVLHPTPLRKVIAFNLLGSGTFVLFGVAARRGGAAGFLADPVPQAMVITGIVVAFASTALAVALLLRLQETGASSIETTPPEQQDNGAS